MYASVLTQASVARVTTRASSARNSGSVAAAPLACAPATRGPALRLRLAGRHGWSASRSCAAMKRLAAAEDSSASSAPVEKEEETEEDFSDEPINAAEALEWGQNKFDQAEYEDAINLFRQVFTLPGSGALRYQGTLKEISCASSGEENAALYNIACSYGKMGRVEEGLQALGDCMENGFEEYEAMRSDPDLASIRQSPEFDKVIGKYDNIISKLKGKKSGTNKSWLDRW